MACAFMSQPACEAGGILVATGVSPWISFPKEPRARGAGDRRINDLLSPASRAHELFLIERKQLQKRTEQKDLDTLRWMVVTYHSAADAIS